MKRRPLNPYCYNQENLNSPRCKCNNQHDYYLKERYKCGKHFHYIEGLTSPTKEHDHEYSDITMKTIKDKDNHIHYYKITTSFDNGHTHKLCGNTGPAVFAADGSHVHMYEGITSLDYGHVHFYGDYTSIDTYKNKRGYDF